MKQQPRVLGVLGGMSWESTAIYYRLLNQGVVERRGGLHSAPLLLHSVDFAPVAAMQAAHDWTGAAVLLGGAAAGLRVAGAQALLLATNTMHKVAAEIETTGGLPLLHIADATGAALEAPACAMRHCSARASRWKIPPSCKTGFGSVSVLPRRCLTLPAGP
jgi:aspartate racemase